MQLQSGVIRQLNELKYHPDVEPKPGVYLFFHAVDGPVVYVGRSGNLRERIRNRGYAYYTFMHCATLYEAYWHECALFHTYWTTLDNRIHPAKLREGENDCPVCKTGSLLQQTSKKYHRGNYMEAIEDFSKVIQLSADAYFNRGLARYKLGDSHGSIQDFTQAIRIDPEFSRAYKGRGNSHYKLGNYRQAARDYTQATLINPTDASLYYNKAKAHQLLNENDVALENFKKSAEFSLRQNDLSMYQRTLKQLEQLQTL
jgi:tetratricopeptide (TPR) repeat protein